MNSNKKSSDAKLLELFSKLKEPTYKDDEEEEFTWKEYLDMLPKSEPTPKITKTPKPLTITLPDTLPDISLSKTFTDLMTYRPHPYLKPVVPAAFKISLIMMLGFMAAHSGNPKVRLASAAGLGIFALIN